MSRNHPAGYVCVVVPFALSHIITSDGHQHQVERDAQGREVVWLSAEHARMMLCSGLPESLPWREANMQLAANLGPVPRPEPGINVGRLQQAYWEATRPSTILEDAARLRSAVLGGWRTW